MPTTGQMCYNFRDNFGLRKVGKWLRSLKIKELLMSRGTLKTICPRPI